MTFAALDRWGGDQSGTYNWKTDMDNAGANYNCANFRDGMFDSPSPDADLTTGSDQFVHFNQANKKATLMTIGITGWQADNITTKQDNGKLAPDGTSQPFDGHDNTNCDTGPTYDTCCAQIGTAESVLVDGGSKVLDTTFMKDWVTHLTSTFGDAAHGGIAYYQLDNEPDDWQHLRGDIFPSLYPGVGQCTVNVADPVTGLGVSMNDDFINRTLAYASAIKGVDPHAQVLFMSMENPQDLASIAQNNCGATSQGPYDFDASGTPYGDSTYSVANPITAEILRRAAAKEASAHVRLLDCVDFHYGNGASAFWTPGTPEAAIQGWINANYPGTATCISEYSWPGGLTDGADYLGTFGRYGLRLAANWGGLGGNIGGAYIFRDYDGAGAQIASVSIGAASPVTDFNVYAASDSVTAPSKLWVVLVNGSGGAVSKSVVINHFTPAKSTVSIYRVTSATAAPSAASAGSISASSGGYTVAAISVPAGQVALLVIE